MGFSKLKGALTSARNLHPLVLEEPFKLTCDASDYAIRVILRQHVDEKPNVTYYVALNDAQLNYTVTNKEFSAMIFGFEKFAHI